MSKMNHWLHSFILFCVELDSDQYSSIGALAKKSGQPKSFVKKKLDDLIELGLINLANPKKWQCNPYHYGIGDLKTSPAEVIKALHIYNYTLSSQVFECGLKNLNDQRLAKARMWLIDENEYQNLKKELSAVMTKLDTLANQKSIKQKNESVSKRFYGFQLSLGPLFLD